MEILVVTCEDITTAKLIQTSNVLKIILRVRYIDFLKRHFKFSTYLLLAIYYTWRSDSVVHSNSRGRTR